MSGKELRKILQEDGVNISFLAAKLGYANDQRLHSALKSENLKSGLIEAIAAATNKSVGYYYREGSTSIGNANENSVLVAGDGNTVDNISSKFIALLEQKDRQIDRLLDIIETLGANH